MQEPRRVFFRDHLPPELYDRVAKLLGMVGSSHDGEALNAARLADRVVREAGMTWFDALQPTLPGPEPRRARHHPEQPPGGWRHTAQACLAADTDGILTHWERQFIVSLLAFPRISTKQAEILLRCHQKLCERGAFS